MILHIREAPFIGASNFKSSFSPAKGRLSPSEKSPARKKDGDTGILLLPYLLQDNSVMVLEIITGKKFCEKVSWKQYLRNEVI